MRKGEALKLTWDRVDMKNGIINLGEVIFLPGEVRITNQLAAKGSSIGAGFAVLGISLAEKVVYINLPADNQGALDVGDAVSVEMPDYTEVPATVIFVSQTATPAQNDWDPATFEGESPGQHGGSRISTASHMQAGSRASSPLLYSPYSSITSSRV